MSAVEQGTLTQPVPEEKRVEPWLTPKILHELASLSLDAQTFFDGQPPLFAHALGPLGLVTDIGGMLAHGSIVAREYGIPAVLGTGNGTQRIVTGQRITVDGDSGTVTMRE